MILHTVNKPRPLSRCLSLAGAGDAILLLEDGVYAAMDNADNRRFWKRPSHGTRHYALAADLAARGISDKMLPLFDVVSWQEFVALTLESDKIISWG